MSSFFPYKFHTIFCHSFTTAENFLCGIILREIKTWGEGLVSDQCNSSICDWFLKIGGDYFLSPLAMYRFDFLISRSPDSSHIDEVWSALWFVRKWGDLVLNFRMSFLALCLYLSASLCLFLSISIYILLCLKRVGRSNWRCEAVGGGVDVKKLVPAIGTPDIAGQQIRQLFHFGTSTAKGWYCTAEV